MSEITEEQKQQIIKDYTANLELKAKEAAEQAERDKKGRFKPKPSAQTTSEPPADPSTPTSPPEKDELLDEIEGELQKALKGLVDPNELVGLDQRMRIKMLRILAKTENGKRAATVDPTNPAPPTEDHIPTLVELNRADKYKADMQKQSSYVGMAKKWRGI